MISELNFISRLATSSIQEFASKFQGRIVYSITHGLRGDQMVELAKIIASLAVMILSVVVVTAGLYWLLFQEHARQIEPDDHELQPRVQVPIPNLSPKITKTKKNLVDDFSKPSSPSVSPLFTPKQSPVLPKQSPVLYKPAPKPISLPHYSIDITALTHFDLSSVPETLPLTLISDAQKDQLKQNLINACHLIREVDRQIGPYCTFPRQIPDDSVLSKINQLGSLQNDAQNYEFLATQLNSYLEPYYSAYALSYASQPLSQMLQDPIRQLFAQIHKLNLSLVFGALAEKHFNEDHYPQCIQISKKISHNSDLADELQLAVSRHYINQGQIDQALLVLKECSYKSEREDLKLYIAKAYFNKGNLDQALKIAKDMHYSKEREEFILNIAKIHCLKGNIDTALKMAEDMSYSKERDEFFKAIAKGYINQSNWEKSLKIVKDMSYGKERDDLFQTIAKGYVNQNNLEKASKVAEDMSYGKERTELRQIIAKAYINQNDPEKLEKALKIAEDLSYG